MNAGSTHSINELKPGETGFNVQIYQYNFMKSREGGKLFSEVNAIL